MKRLTGIIAAFVMILSMGLSCLAGPGADIDDNPHVLFLSSYSYDWESIPLQLSGITETLDDYAQIEYVFMDTKRLDYEKIRKSVYEDVLLREQAEPFDYVIAGDDAALRFVTDYRETLFLDTPVIFEGINDVSFAFKAAQDPLITGIVETFPLRKTISLAQRIHPGATKIVAITDESISGKGSTRQLLDCASSFPELTFSTINCSELTLREIGEAISAFSGDTILLFLMMSTDSEGNTYSNPEAIEFVTTHARIPIYKTDELGIGKGILGGVVISYHDMAADAAAMVLALHQGTDFSTFTVQTVQEICVFDKQVMDQFGIRKKDIRAAYDGDVIYINDQKSFYQRHRSVILTLGAIILLLMGILVYGLLIFRSRQKIMDELTSKNKMLDNILNNMPGGVMIFRVNTQTEAVETLYFSQGIPAISGHTEEEYRGLIRRDIFNCGIVGQDIDRLRAALTANVRNKEPVRLTFHQMHTNGSEVWVAMSAIWCRDEKDGGRIYNAVFVDVTQQEKIQAAEREALEARASSEAKSEFLSCMSHDIRTPLNAMLGFTSLALDEPDIPSDVAGCLENIRLSGKYLLGLVNDVLDMAKIESGKLELHEESVNGPEFLSTLADLFKAQAAEKGITLSADFSRAQTPWIVLDALRMRQIFSNLLSNAIKFSQSGTEIHWTITNISTGPDTVHTVTVIRDQGIGMPPAFMENMFGAFEQGSPSDASSGTGLGLSIVKNLVTLMGGTIQVESELGKGSVFTVEFDRKLGSPQPDSQDSSSCAVSISGCRILLCEDNKINTLVTERILEKAGCLMDQAENGQVGVDLFTSSAPGRYDAILMDIRMPVMDGLKAAEAIRALDRPDARTIPIIAMSANAFDEDVKRSLAVGMNAHLAKPIDRQKLYDTLIRLISQRKQPGVSA